MVSKRTQARIGARGAMAIARRPALRRATMRAGGPVARAGWGVGKRVARRRAYDQIERIGAAGRTAGSIAVIYGPIAAEALGLVDAPKRKRRAPAFAAGAITGAAVALLLSRRLAAG